MADDFEDDGGAAAPGAVQGAGDDPAGEDSRERLILSIEGYEGPLDALLDLAQRQKVDLRRISVLALAEQYLAFVNEARRHRIDLAADYLVMAAWLAYLKSRLLLPEPAAGEEPSGAELAEALARRLARLEAIRRAGSRLMERPRLGREVFARGMAEPVAETNARPGTKVSLSDLLKAYSRVRTRDAYRPLGIEKRAEVMALDDARTRLERLIGRRSLDAVGGMAGWARLEDLLPDDWRERPDRRRTATASSFAAALELAKRGEVEIAQDGAFAPLRLRPRRDTSDDA